MVKHKYNNVSLITPVTTIKMIEGLIKDKISYDMKCKIKLKRSF